MADYNEKYLTNYFSVTDEMKFKNLIEACVAEDEIEIFEAEQADGSVKYGFGCLKIIHGIPPEDGGDNDCEESIDTLYTCLQKLLPPGEAIIVTQIGWEKLNYFTACCTVITCDGIQSIDARDEAVKLAGKMLNNPCFKTEMDY